MSAIDDTDFEEGYERLCFFAASQVANLFWAPYGAVSRLLTPLDPKKLDNAPNRVLEVAKRALVATGFCFAFVKAGSFILFLSLIPLAACLALRSLGLLLQKGGFSYVKGDERALSFQNGECSVLVWTLPGDREGHWKSREGAILSKIGKENPDVAILLGVEDTDFCEDLLLSRRNDYSHAFAYMGADPLGRGSHALILVKNSVSSFRHIPFHCLGKTLSSGFDIVEIKESPESPHPCLRIVAVAAQPEDQTMHVEREMQMNQIMEALQEQKAVLPTLFAGSFYEGEKALEDRLCSTNLEQKLTMTEELTAQLDQPIAHGTFSHISLVKRDGESLPTRTTGISFLNCHLVEAFDELSQEKRALSTEHGIIARFALCQ